MQKGEAEKEKPMKGQPNLVSGLRVPEEEPNPFSLQPRVGKQGMNKYNTGPARKKDCREGGQNGRLFPSAAVLNSLSSFLTK